MKLLGFGAMRLPLADGDQNSIDQAQVNAMAESFIEAGFTYIDTAYPYHDGKSEPACRQAFVERYDRDAFILADKMPTFFITEANQYDHYFTEQIQRCGVDYFDYYLLHNLNRKSYDLTTTLGGFDYCRRLRDQGKAKRIGFSFHDKAEVLDEILTKHPDMEFVQLQINYLDWENDSVQSRLCYETARKHNKPVVVMEPLKGGGLAALPDEAEALLKARRPDLSVASWAIRFAASLEGVITVLSGMSDLVQLRDNISYMADFTPLDPSEREAVDAVAEIMRNTSAVPCTGCRYCVKDCPQNIDIPAYFSVYNNLKTFGTRNFPAMHYSNLAYGNPGPADCVGCRLCENNCPQHLSIPESLTLVAEAFAEDA